MARGIVKDKPTATRGRLIVVVPGLTELQRFEEVEFVYNAAELTLDDKDAVQFTLTPENIYMVTHKMDAPRGIVQDGISNRGGSVVMTEPFPNEFEVGINDKIDFHWAGPPDPFPQAKDEVQVIIYSPNMALLVKVIK